MCNKILAITFLILLMSNCSNNANKPEQNGQVIEHTVEAVEISKPVAEEPMEDRIYEDFIIGRVNDDGLRIRSVPSTNSEIVGLLNAGDEISVIEVSKDKVFIGNFENYWYKIITGVGLTGWVFGEYIDFPVVGKPEEFSDFSWSHNYGKLDPIKTIALDELQSCSWQREFTFLHFSKEGHYANLSRSGFYYGNYLLHNNSIFFSPSLKIYRFAEEYAVDWLYYSNELHFVGAPVLRTDDETVVFSANGSINAENGEMVRMYQVNCIKMWGKAYINSNGVLYSLPDVSSKNMFEDNSYGRKSSEAFIIKRAKTMINNEVWYYTFFDFGGDEPSDGGGPFYEGWLPEKYFK